MLLNKTWQEKDEYQTFLRKITKTCYYLQLPSNHNWPSVTYTVIRKFSTTIRFVIISKQLNDIDDRSKIIMRGCLLQQIRYKKLAIHQLPIENYLAKLRPDKSYYSRHTKRFLFITFDFFPSDDAKSVTCQKLQFLN